MSAAGGAVRALEDPDLPPGWMKLHDAASGRTYYWDKGGSGQTTYTRPVGSSSTQVGLRADCRCCARFAGGGGSCGRAL